MSNLYLNPVYKDVFGESFNVSDFDDRLKMQKMVYLLQNLGISVGNYNFIWYKHGPYSGELQNDMHEKYSENYTINYSQDARETIERLKTVIFVDRDKVTDKNKYSDAGWLECLGALHYIKTKILRSDATEKEVVNALMEKKPHLNNECLNSYALEELNRLFN